MKYFCPECRHKFELKAAYAGKRINCGSCGNNFDVASRIMPLRMPGPTIAERLSQLEATDPNNPEIAKLQTETEERLDIYWRNWSELFGDFAERPPKRKFLDIMDVIDANYGIFRWRNSFQEYQLIEEYIERWCSDLLK